MELRRCIFILIDDRLFSHTGMALDAAAAAAAVDNLSLHPCSPPRPPSSPPADKPEWFLPGEPVTVTAAVTAAEVCEQRGGEGRLHPLPAIAVRRLLLWSHTRKTFQFCICIILQARREDHCVCEGERVSWIISAVCGSAVSLQPQGAEWMCVPLRIQASDNGTSRGNLATSLLAKLYLRAMLSG